MKKGILSFMMIVTLLLCATACGDVTDETHLNTEQGTETEKTTYELLNDLAKQRYSKVKLDVVTVTGDVELKANYVLTEKNVTYSVEQLNLLPIDGSVADLSSEYKTTLTGTATVENGTVTKLDGAEVTLPSYDELKGAFHFEESNLKNVREEDGMLTADVVSASDFLGTKAEISNMTLKVSYSESALQIITLIYQTPRSTVTTVYSFEST